MISRSGHNDNLYKKYQETRDKYKPTFECQDELLSNKTISLTDSYKKLIGSARLSNYLIDYENNFKNRKSFVGTAYYVAPEMLENNEIDYGCDLWSIGIIVYRLLTGEYLFNEGNDYLIFQKILKGTYYINESLQEDTKDFIRQLLKKNPKKRLGNQTDDFKKNINSLKSHPFFKTIIWQNSKSWISPFVKEVPETIKEMKSPFTLEKVDRNDKKVLLCGLVKKFKF